MKNSIKITALLIMAASTALIITTAYNRDDSEQTAGEKLGTAVRETTDVVADTAQGIVNVGANAVKDTASIVTTGHKRTQAEKKEETKKRRLAEKERKS